MAHNALLGVLKTHCSQLGELLSSIMKYTHDEYFDVLLVDLILLYRNYVVLS